MEIVSATALSGVASSVLPEVPPSPAPPQAVTTSAVASTVAATLVDWRSFTGFLSEGAGAASAGDEPRCSWAARADPRTGVRTDGIEVSTPRYGVSQWADSRTHTNGAAPPAASSLSPTAVGTSGVVSGQVRRLLPTDSPT